MADYKIDGHIVDLTKRGNGGFDVQVDGIVVGRLIPSGGGHYDYAKHGAPTPDPLSKHRRKRACELLMVSVSISSPTRSRPARKRTPRERRAERMTARREERKQNLATRALFPELCSAHTHYTCVIIFSVTHPYADKLNDAEWMVRSFTDDSFTLGSIAVEGESSPIESSMLIGRLMKAGDSVSVCPFRWRNVSGKRSRDSLDPVSVKVESVTADDDNGLTVVEYSR